MVNHAKLDAFNQKCNFYLNYPAISGLFFFFFFLSFFFSFFLPASHSLQPNPAAQSFLSLLFLFLKYCSLSVSSSNVHAQIRSFINEGAGGSLLSI